MAAWAETADTKITYDSRTDTLSVLFRDGAEVVESDEIKPGVVLDYDDHDRRVSIEILDASARVTEPERVDFDRMA